MGCPSAEGVFAWVGVEGVLVRISIPGPGHGSRCSSPSSNFRPCRRGDEHEALPVDRVLCEDDCLNSSVAPMLFGLLAELVLYFFPGSIDSRHSWSVFSSAPVVGEIERCGLRMLVMFLYILHIKK